MFLIYQIIIGDIVAIFIQYVSSARERFAMLFKRTVLTKILSNGMKAEFAIVMEEGEFQAALMVNGRFVSGPALPRLLDPPKDDITHWMGNRPGVGLTTDEADKIVREVMLENSAVEHRKKLAEE
jgi:hypothetical protein